MQELIVEGLPNEYKLEWDPDILILRRLDGAMVAAFSAQGFAPEAVLKAAEEDAHRDPSSHPREMSILDSSSARYFLRVKLFGHFEVLCNDEVVTLGRSGKALTILKYLLVYRRPVSQDHLMGWLWPESNLRKARWSLNSSIHSLRKLLGSWSQLADCSKQLLLEGGHYRLSPAIRVETDVGEFDAHCEQGRRLEREGREQEAAEEYERAIKLYRDDYLIENLYEDWTMVERERLSSAYVYMLGRLAAHYMQRGQLQESIQACYRLLEKDRCHEESYRLLMCCYMQLGLREKTLRQYRVCEEVLTRKYGTSPSPETQALYECLLKDESA